MNTNFELESGEVAIERIHRHWFIFVLETLGLIAAAVLPPFFILFMSKMLVLNISGSLFAFGYSLWLLFVWLAFFILFTDYYLDVWVITSKRIVGIEQIGLFNRTATSCFISKIQDVEIKIDGVIPTLLNFGDIRLHTAGAERGVLSMGNIPAPQRVKELILRLGHPENI